MTILFVVAIFVLLVFVHELGHFVAARMRGIRVEEFGFGFPPRIIGIKRGGTIYSVNALPLGGFVRLAGEDSEDTRPGTFGGASFGSKLAVLLAGVGMNALIAYLILIAVCIAGFPSEALKDLNIQGGQTSEGRVLAISVGSESPAGKAGIQRGDQIVSGNGQAFHTEDALISFAKDHAGQKVQLTVEREGARRNVEIQLRPAEEGVARGYLGLSPLAVSTTRFGASSVWAAAEILGKMMWGTVAGFGGLIAGLLTRAKVSEDVVGIVGIVSIFDSIMIFGWRYVAFFVASISVSLAVINILPVPALDGGRLFLLVVRKLMRRPISAQTEARIHLTGFALLLALMAIVTFVDISRLRS